jgi:hypothetical protein
VALSSSSITLSRYLPRLRTSFDLLFFTLYIPQPPGLIGFGLFILFTLILCSFLSPPSFRFAGVFPTPEPILHPELSTLAEVHPALGFQIFAGNCLLEPLVSILGPPTRMEVETDLAAPSPATTPPAPGGGAKLTEPRRRNRPALSCIQCRTRKIRCDRSEPCASCRKSKIVNCTYEEARRPKPRLWRLSPAPASASGQRGQSPIAEERLVIGPGFTFREVKLPSGPPQQDPPRLSPTSGAPARTPEHLSTSSPMAHQGDCGPGNTAALAERIRQLEQQLSEALKRPDHGANSYRLNPVPIRDASSGRLLEGDKLVGCLRTHSAQRFSFPSVADSPTVSSDNWTRKAHQDRKELQCIYPAAKVQSFGQSHHVYERSNP